MMRMSDCKDLKKEAVSFVVECLKGEKQPRDDYREMLELTLIFMGEVSPNGIHARWMAKIIYCFKI